MKISVVLTGRQYHLAEALPEELTLAEGATVQDAIDHLATLLPNDQSFPPSCLVALGGKHLGTVADHQTTALTEGDELMLIAPVAGG